MRATVSATFLVSGMAGLIFEVVWFHRTGLVFGNSVWATSLVLSAFMAGLALGNTSVSWFAHRLRRPMLAYAALEAAVAVTGLGLSMALPSLTIALAAPIRGAAVFTLLVLPATAMGATLPLLTGALSRAQAAFGRTLGLLYGWNTLGAVAGVVLAEVVLVDRVGVSGAAWTAATLNLAAALSGLWISRRFEYIDRPADQFSPPATPRARRLLTGAFLAGALLLALEVIWFRFLSMFVLTTTLATGLTLAAVLAAIGGGGLAASWWIAKRPQAARHAAAVAWLGGGTVVASYAAFQRLTGGVQVGEWTRVLWFACALGGPTSFLSGVLFTLIGDAVYREVRTATRAAAWLTAANTVGAMLGPPIAAFLLLPYLGMERSLFAIAIGYGALGLLTMPATSIDRAPARRTAIPIGVWATGLALIAALAFFPFGLSSEYFRRVAKPYAVDGSEIVAQREGPAETILLMQQKWLGQPVYSRLVTNGFSMSGTATSGQRYMRDFVYWPLLMHAGPLRRVLVICYGAGVTAGAAVDVPSAEIIDVVELSRDIVAMSDVIYPPESRPLNDPRVRLRLEDGRTFLQAGTTRYDLITGEPPPPRTPGAVNIYTREYFRLIYDRLAEGGMATYWLPVARPDPGADVNTIIRAFCDAFADCSLWNATPFDFMLAGTRHGRPQSAEGLAGNWMREPLARRLREVGFEQPEQIGATFLGDAEYLRALTSSTPPLTDDFPHRIVPVAARPSLSDPRYREDPGVVALFQRVLDPARARSAFAASSFIAALWPREAAQRTLGAFDVQRIINRVLWDGGRPLQQIEDLHAVLTGTTLRTLPLWLLGSDDTAQRIAGASAERNGATEFTRGAGALASRDYRRAAAYFSEAERRGPPAPVVRPLLVYALCLAGDVESARRLARGIPARDADEQHFWRWLHDAYGV